MTYNILDGGGDEGSGSRLDAIVEVLRRAGPDLLVLQECNGFEREGGAVLRRVERALGMQGALATAGSGHHVALLARDATWIRTCVLRAGFCHAAIVAELALKGRRLTVAGAHLDPFQPRTRAREARALLSRASGARLRVLMGDLNALSPRDLDGYRWTQWPQRYRDRHGCLDGTPDTAAIEAIEAAGFVDLAAAAGQALPTRPTRLCAKADVPSQRLDYIFAEPELAAALERLVVLDGDDVQAASDHLPVLAEINGTLEVS